MAAIPRFGTRVVPELQHIIQQCREGGELVRGAHIDAFEQELAEFLGSGHVRTCSTEYGRTALYFILTAMQFPPGSEVIVPALTFWVVPEIARVAGLTPVFADIDPATFNLCPAAVERAITPNTRAVLPTHLYGLSCDMDPILEDRVHVAGQSIQMRRQHGAGVRRDRAFDRSWTQVEGGGID